MSKVIKRLFDLLRPRKALVGRIDLQRLQPPQDGVVMTRMGRRTAIDDIIERIGARPGDTVVVEQDGQASIVGRKPGKV